MLLPADGCSRSAVGGPTLKEGGHPRCLDPGGRCQAARHVEQGRQRCPGRQQNLVLVVYVAAEILQPGRSVAEAEELVVDEAILDVVELSTSSIIATLILYKVLDKSISPDENTKANVAVNHKRSGREQGTDVCEEGICIEHALCCSVRISSRDTLDENLGLVKIEVEAIVLLE